ncbi:helix-turn-helix domain-containing protein [Piscinibacter koreensis]|uniref:Helix-turn-helix domain-containing protein n=1 Tax=Piscinibacter koreensis TaxID=2742824 RepID=A0A7Y6NP98_9BURK|nr:helix-turn-helix domain-containing protein [Schlegelella koreensis]NUZ06742.1 helix-turn-helix domain-containing protein [Schlegelella koreensis]
MHQAGEVEPLLTSEDVAARLRVSPATVTTWRSRGSQAIPFIKVGRLVRYRASDLAAYLEGRSREAKPCST